jgi:hypothetical protein
MTVTPPPPGDYPGPLRSFLVAVAKDGDVLGKWWEEGPDPAKGKYGHLWADMSQPQRDVLLSGNLKQITAAIEDEARAFPKTGEEVDSAKGLAWALVRI